MSDVVTREVLHIPNAAAVLPYDPVTDQTRPDRAVSCRHAGASAKGRGCSRPWPGSWSRARSRRQPPAARSSRSRRRGRAAGDDRRLYRLAGCGDRAHHGLHRRDRQPRRPAACTGSPPRPRTSRATSSTACHRIRLARGGADRRRQRRRRLRWLQVHGEALRRRWLARTEPPAPRSSSDSGITKGPGHAGTHLSAGQDRGAVGAAQDQGVAGRVRAPLAQGSRPADRLGRLRRHRPAGPPALSDQGGGHRLLQRREGLAFRSSSPTPASSAPRPTPTTSSTRA
jgi:hypothetical protein